MLFLIEYDEYQNINIFEFITLLINNIKNYKVSNEKII